MDEYTMRHFCRMYDEAQKRYNECVAIKDYNGTEYYGGLIEGFRLSLAAFGYKYRVDVIGGEKVAKIQERVLGKTYMEVH